MIKHLYILGLIITSPLVAALSINHTQVEHNPYTKTIYSEFKLESNEAVIASSIHTSIDNPFCSIPFVSIDQTPQKLYIPTLHQTKEVYQKNFVIACKVESNKQNIDAHMHISYSLAPDNNVHEVIVPVAFSTPSTSHSPSLVYEEHEVTPYQGPEEKDVAWSERVQNLLETTKNPWFLILLSLLLGLLLSLTPCIYPMIPITIGILHSKGKQSLAHNFLGSLLYGCGMALTFACLGLLAALAGNTFGALLSEPLVVIALVLFIGYMSLTMIGVIDLYIPRFLQGQTNISSAFGPLLSAFLFGIVSGTVSSPCVSPGLVVLLSAVAQSGNQLIGFAQLFAFGIGLSTPLIIIGTFSSSLHMLPKSGMWMLEIKKFLGFIMLATCLYYLANILPLYIVYWLAAFFGLFMALFYFIDGKHELARKSKYVKNGIGMLALCVALLIGTQAFDLTFGQDTTPKVSVNWAPSYQAAIEQARAENKKVIVDFWAQHCTICKAIDKKIFSNQTIKDALQDSVIFVKIDATNVNNPEYVILKKQYTVNFQPVILIVDPTNETILKRWSDEPYRMSIEQFISEVKKTITQ